MCQHHEHSQCKQMYWLIKLTSKIPQHAMFITKKNLSASWIKVVFHQDDNYPIMKCIIPVKFCCEQPFQITTSHIASYKKVRTMSVCRVISFLHYDLKPTQNLTS